MVCVECVEGGPFYSPLRSVPAKFIHGNIHNRLQEDQIRLPAKMHLDGNQGRFGRTGRLNPWFGRIMGSAGCTLEPLATVFLHVSALWVLMLVCQCRGPVGWFGLLGGPLLYE